MLLYLLYYYVIYYIDINIVIFAHRRNSLNKAQSQFELTIEGKHFYIRNILIIQSI